MIFKKSTLLFMFSLTLMAGNSLRGRLVEPPMVVEHTDFTPPGDTNEVAPIVEHSRSMIETMTQPCMMATTTSIPPMAFAAALQSPINIIQATEKNLPDIIFNYPDSMQFDLSFTGHSVQATVSEKDAVGNDQTASIELYGKIYDLVQFHMHAPSEHLVSHKRYPLEWHFVHQNSSDQSRVVIGVFMEDGQETTPAYRTLLDTLEEQITEENKYDRTPHGLGSCSFSPRSLIPEDQRCWRYDGSLTSAPYSPVYWCVVRATTTINAKDMGILFTAMQVHTRSVQDLDDREVFFDSRLDSAPIKQKATQKKITPAAKKVPKKKAKKATMRGRSRARRAHHMRTKKQAHA